MKKIEILIKNIKKSDLYCCECNENICKNEEYVYTFIQDSPKNKKYHTCTICDNLRKKFNARYGLLANRLSYMLRIKFNAKIIEDNTTSSEEMKISELLYELEQ